MAYANERPSGGNTFIIACSIIGGIILVIVLVCGGLAFYAFQKMGPLISDVQGGLKTANTFLEHLRGDHLDEAYQMTSEAFQARMGQKEFEDYVGRHPGLEQGSEVTNQDMHYSGDLTKPTFTFSINQSTGESLEVRLTLIKGEEVFKVDKFSVEEKAGKKGATSKKQTSKVNDRSTPPAKDKPKE